jgi:hypothetical protein
MIGEANAAREMSWAVVKYGLSRDPVVPLPATGLIIHWMMIGSGSLKVVKEGLTEAH